MTHAEFRLKQSEMDDAGMVTYIRTIRVSKTGKKVGYKTAFTYKYRYEVILNGEIVKQTKSRKTAKNFLMEYFEAKKELDSANAKMKRTFKKVNTTIKGK